MFPSFGTTQMNFRGGTLEKRRMKSYLMFLKECSVIYVALWKNRAQATFPQNLFSEWYCQKQKEKTWFKAMKILKCKARSSSIMLEMFKNKNDTYRFMKCVYFYMKWKTGFYAKVNYIFVCLRSFHPIVITCDTCNRK